MKRKKIKPEKLEKRLEQHKLYVQTDGKEGERLVLINRDLRGCIFNYLDLTDADFEGSDLRGASFYKSKLEDVDFSNTKMSDVDLSNTDLTDANFFNAKLHHANFECANLRSVSFNDAKLKGAKFSQANITHTNGIQFYSVDNVGTFSGKITFIPSLNIVFAGCWEGNFTEFIARCSAVSEARGDEKITKELNATIVFFTNFVEIEGGN